MIIDTAIRVLRYVELDGAGRPCAEMTASIFHGTEEGAFTELVAAAAQNGHTIVRLCNHDEGCRAPRLDEIEGDGRGGFRAKARFPGALRNVERWDEATMLRAFVPVYDEIAKVTYVVRLDAGQWTPEIATGLVRDVAGTLRVVPSE